MMRVTYYQRKGRYVSYNLIDICIVAIYHWSGERILLGKHKKGSFREFIMRPYPAPKFSPAEIDHILLVCRKSTENCTICQTIIQRFANQSVTDSV